MARKPFDPDAVLAAALESGRACGDLEMRIGRDGTWYYRGSAVRRPALVKLFAGILRRGPDGGYWLVTPVEQVLVEVEDAPFTVVELRQAGGDGAPVIELRTNLDDWLPLGPAHELRVAAEGGVPYVQVRDGLEARVVQSVYYELAELGEPLGDRLVVRSGGATFALGPLDD